VTIQTKSSVQESRSPFLLLFLASEGEHGIPATILGSQTSGTYFNVSVTHEENKRKRKTHTHPCAAL